MLAKVPTDGAGGNIFTGSLQPRAVTLHLGVERGQLQAKGDRFGMDAVGTAHANRILMLKGPQLDRFQQHLKIGQQFIGSLNHLYGEAGVQYVRRSHSLMDKAVFRADKFGN